VSDSKLIFSKNWLGSLDFGQSLEYQKGLKKSVNKAPFFLGFEPRSSVISLGLRADLSHVLKNESQLKKADVSVVRVRRGGEATLHNPGQLVIYPVIHLRDFALKVKDFIVALQDITQTLLKQLGIETTKGESFAGLYTEKGKIAFFGIHISQGVSQSGLSLNVDNDLSLFESIKSCGELHRPHDRTANYKAFSKKALFFKWCEIAEAKFSIKMN